MPATADIIGKAANGIADDLLSTAIITSPLPVVFAPAMNPVMFNSAPVRRNLARLAEDGHYIIAPEVGTSVTTGEFDTGLGPNVDAVMRSLWHVLMRRYKDEYWHAVTSTRPATAVTEATKPLPLVAAGARGNTGIQPTSTGA
jgi:phosphopantothenoylcysteine decarboxylase/phosphopantothenate--cysteine ligase